VCARQELDFSHIDVPTPPLRDPEIRRVDGSVQQQQQQQLPINRVVLGFGSSSRKYGIQIFSRIWQMPVQWQCIQLITNAADLYSQYAVSEIFTFASATKVSVLRYLLALYVTMTSS